MKILVTGGAGFIGSHLTHFISQAGAYSEIITKRPLLVDHSWQLGEMDDQGRIALPVPLREYAGIVDEDYYKVPSDSPSSDITERKREDEVVIAGANTYLELWNKEQWEAKKAISKEQAWANYRKPRATWMSAIMLAPAYSPVRVKETIGALAVQLGGRYIEARVVVAGVDTFLKYAEAVELSAAAVLEHSSPGGQLLGIDADPEAIKTARTRLEAYSDSTLLINGNFVNLQAICYKHDFLPVQGILFDPGLSSFQLNDNGRGFSFQHDAPLDMRLNPNQELTVADIISTYSETELTRLIKTCGEEGYSRRVARRVVQERPIKNTLQLARMIEQVIGGRRSRIHPATKTFQALRISVNQELEHLETALKQTVNLLGFEGRLVVISYHSLEDRIVKQFLQREAKDCVCLPGTPIEYRKLVTEIVYINLHGPEEPTPGITGDELLHGYLVELYKAPNPKVKTMSVFCREQRW